MCSSTSCIESTQQQHTPTRDRRKRKRAVINTTIYKAFVIYLIICIAATSSYYIVANAAVWTNGPEDRFFCGIKWDDANCQSRQHCPSGRSEECEGNEDGVKCFANTNCDTRYGDGDWYVPGKPPKQSPGGTERPTFDGQSEEASDHYWCGVGLDDAKESCGTHCPSGTSSECPQGNVCYHNVLECDARNLVPPTPLPTTDFPTSAPFSGPTKIPTEMPIEPPDPLPFPSVDPKDHMYCGIGIDDASARCEVHCPSASECPSGQICYFGTQCDARTFSPTPPPTRRPTPDPTLSPTGSPTDTMPPSFSPTSSTAPTAPPSEQIPTKSPTTSPTGKPTYAPMPALQASFFCGVDWKDTIENCKRRCPSGESTECPFDEHCFSLTGCTEERGYPEEYGLVESGPAEGGDGSCVPLEVTIVADNWPKETTWQVVNTEVENEVIAEGTSDDLVPGETVQYLECVNNRKGCYEFIINDSGGDGICCEHGNGSYKVSYDGVELKQGAAFYDKEITPFGLCGATEEPTAKPASPNNGGGGGGGGGGKPGDLAYRCVANALVDSGYEILSDKCDLFVDCFNQHINVGDNWFCGDDEQCVEAPACIIELTNEEEILTTDEQAPASSSPEEEDNETPEIVQLPIVLGSSPPPTNDGSIAPRPNPAGGRPVPAPSAGNFGGDSVATGTNPQTPTPIEVDTTTEPPTLNPTSSQPTLGPCDGAKCNQKDHCRSKYGFCGPGDTYCDDTAIWTKDCETNPPATSKPTISASVASEDLSSMIEATESPTSPAVTPQPSTKKPWSKPGGGKGPTAAKPARTHSPITNYPTRKVTDKPTNEVIVTRSPTVNPSMSDTVAADDVPKTSPPSPDVQPPSNRPTKQPTFQPVTASPSKNDVESSSESESSQIQEESAEDSSSSEAQPVEIDSDNWTPTHEYDCTGEPCPVDTHCRSRYGSCGPGFIYCNVYSVWKNTCPPPGSRPSRSPTPKPTREAVPSASPTKTRISQPTLPPLPKPSLPTITEAMPAMLPSTVTATDEVVAVSSDEAVLSSDEAIDGELESSTDEDEKGNNDAPKPLSPSNSAYFQSPGYLDEWLRENDAADPYPHVKKGVGIIVASVSLVLLLF